MITRNKKKEAKKKREKGKGKGREKREDIIDREPRLDVRSGACGEGGSLN